MAQYQLVIGLDFGTSNSCVAWTFVDTDEVTRLINANRFSWQGVGIHMIKFANDHQTPSVLYWIPDQQSPKDKGRWTWGMEELHLTKKISRVFKFELFKLGLNHSGNFKRVSENLMAQIGHLPPSAKVHNVDDLITLYLKKLYRYSEKRISMTLGGNEDSSRPFDQLKPRTILTIPAIWDLKMEKRMKKAAINAGIQSPTTVSEAEAGAMLIHFDRCIPLHRPIPTYGDTHKPFLILDCGGGTTDAVTFFWRDRMLHEGTKGTGDSTAGNTLNIEFERLLKDHISSGIEDVKSKWARIAEKPDPKKKGRKPASQMHKARKGPKTRYRQGDSAPVADRFDRLAQAEDEIITDAMIDFEGEKKLVKADSQLLSVKISGLGGADIPSARIYNGHVDLNRSQIDKIFFPLLTQLTNLVCHQLKMFAHRRQGEKAKENQELDEDDEIRVIYFVGAPSYNDYIYQHLIKRFKDYDVIQPPDDAKASVAKGAIIQALRQDAVGERVMRYSLGFEWDEEYDPVKHKGSVPVRDPFWSLDSVEEGEDLTVERRVHWLFQANNKYRNGQEVVQEAVHFVPYHPSGPHTIAQLLYHSDTQTRQGLSVRSRNQGISRLGSVAITLSQSRLKGIYVQPKSYPNIRGKYQKIDYAICAEYRQTSIEFTFLIPRSGVLDMKDLNWKDKCIRLNAEMNLEEFDQKFEGRERLNEFVNVHKRSADCLQECSSKSRKARRMQQKCLTNTSAMLNTERDPQSVASESQRPSSTRNSEPSRVKQRSTASKRAAVITDQRPGNGGDNIGSQSQHSTARGISPPDFREAYEYAMQTSDETHDKIPQAETVRNHVPNASGVHDPERMLRHRQPNRASIFKTPQTPVSMERRARRKGMSEQFFVAGEGSWAKQL